LNNEVVTYPQDPQQGVPGPSYYLPAVQPVSGYPVGMGQPAARPPRSAGAAVALELVLGLFGVFGVGNIYAGRAGLGVALMLSFWVLFWINVALIFVVIGWVTMPLTWVGYLIAGSLLAARGVENHNAGY
jgi:TM2 domain-containing membrane protein YozV